jgi:hypothetical protein
LLSPSVFIQTNASAAVTLQLDYLIAACEANRF